MKNGMPQVFVHLKRHNGNKLLVMIKGDPFDDDPAYFDKLTKDEPVGFVLNPLGDPHRIGIEDGGLYGGEFVLLNDCGGGFGAHPPQALVDLLLPNGAAEAAYPCIAESGEFGLFFTLPEGGSLLSLFFKDVPPSLACKSPVGACTDASLALA